MGLIQASVVTPCHGHVFLAHFPAACRKQLVEEKLLTPAATGTPLFSVAAVAGSSGPRGGTLLDYPLSKRTEEDHETPSPSCLGGNPTPAGL
ncbi:hypothetical protein EYF80_020727 [Liparis tanakae]|uniref:Uncharacterized protein n=1 Tax=Liparis tanakae TaxID=230148 RepID=A0A4Z2HVI6_9TELE|nr:hypothetical protein EYF80_020727 [Liparis tanakae]